MCEFQGFRKFKSTILEHNQNTTRRCFVEVPTVMPSHHLCPIVSSPFEGGLFVLREGFSYARGPPLRIRVPTMCMDHPYHMAVHHISLRSLRPKRGAHVMGLKPIISSVPNFQ